MRARMIDIERQRRLIELAAPDGDAGGLAAKRLPPVGANHKACGQRFSVGGADCNIGFLWAHRFRLIVEAYQRGEFGRALFQRTHRSEEHTSELQSPDHLVCRLLLEKKKKTHISYFPHP